MLVLKNLFSALFPAKTSPLRAPSQRLHFWSIITTFAGLGFHVGIWTVLVADLMNALKLSTTLLGIALSLAARVGSHQGARAVAIVTAFGYSIFLTSPLLIGVLATVFSLRTALLLTIVTSISIALIAQRLPEAQIRGRYVVPGILFRNAR
jgi:hypothetical protein